MSARKKPLFSGVQPKHRLQELKPGQDSQQKLSLGTDAIGMVEYPCRFQLFNSDDFGSLFGT
jgi:hypothetical protein